MLLQNRNAVIHGGGGAIGGAIARAFAREGARVYLAGRTLAKLDAVARDIDAADVAVVDALDERAVNDHAEAVAAAAGGIDVAVNAVGIMHVQGTPLAELSLEDYAHPIVAYTRTHFLTARAAARHMGPGGALLTVSTPGARLVMPGILGFGVACAAIEALSRLLAAELGPSGIRVVCLRPDAIPEAVTAGSHSREVFRPVAERAGLAIEDMLAQAAETGTLLKRMPTLAQVAAAAVFAASDGAGAMTGAVMNLSAGSLVD